MASSEQIKALLASHIEGEDERFFSIALQVAAHEAKIGHGKLAFEIKEIVQEARSRQKKASSLPISIAKGLKDSAGLLYATEPEARLVDLVADKGVTEKLRRVIREQRHIEKIKSHGLLPRRKLLLIGPPGTGKTLTASALAGELHFPLFLVRLDAVITKYMGESSAKLRQVFDAICDVRGVFFFDEFDALGSQRMSSNDVGEARRILNSFLQMIEQDMSNSIIVCATNHVQMLDHALFRRFDDVIQYRLPEVDDIVTLLRSRLMAYADDRFDWSMIAQKAIGLSAAEVTLAAQDAIKELLIQGGEHVSIESVISAIDDRRGMSHQTHT